jgi:hypothetical protein
MINIINRIRLFSRDCKRISIQFMHVYSDALHWTERNFYLNILMSLNIEILKLMIL